MPEIILWADTPTELSARLAELDIDVPSRSEGRRNHHAERYCIAHLLATLPVERLSFPLTLTHSALPPEISHMTVWSPITPERKLDDEEAIYRGANHWLPA